VNWVDGEPNNWSEQDCVQIVPVWGHKWDDDFCNLSKKAICEKKGKMRFRAVSRLCHSGDTSSMMTIATSQRRPSVRREVNVV
jgi:hypothetical protein